MKQFLVALGVIVLLVGVITVSGVAAGASETDADCPCLDPCQNKAEELELLREHPELLLEQTESVQMEWICETYRTVICTDWDSEPCAWCVVPCGIACGPLLALPYGLGFYASCLAGCAIKCPSCPYCVDYEIVEHITCGWVLVE